MRDENIKEKQLPSISFVVPAHNEEDYINNCLKSIEKEIASYQGSAEIIVVNNGSADNTKSVALAFPGSKVIDEPILGSSRARNTGFRASSGDLIANIDADVLLPKGWLNKIVDAFAEDEKLVAVSGPYRCYDMSETANLFVFLYYCLAHVVYIINCFIIRVGSVIQGGDCVIKRSALEKIGGYDVAFEFYGDDTDLARRLFSVGKVKFGFRFWVYSSGRRLLKEGIIVMAVRYSLNYVWTLFFRKPFTSPRSGIKSERND